MRTAIAAGLALLAGASLAAEPAALPAASFAFSRDKLAGLEEAAPLTERDGVTVKDVRFASPSRAGKVRGFLVAPKGEGPFAAVLFVHWLGDAKADRTEFLDEAVGLAQHGVVSLLVEGMWAAPGWFEKQRKPQTDVADAVAQVKELQRAMDLLLAQKGVDPARVAYVGHDFGAMYGVLMGAAEPRAKTYVLLAPTATFHEWFLLAKQKPADVPAYVAQLAPLDPTRYLKSLKASVFLQFAQTDRFVPPEKVKALGDAAGEPKLVKVYENEGHAMTHRDGLNDRYRWLKRELGL